MLLLPGFDLAAAAQHAEDLRRNVAAISVRYGDKTLPRITISLGIAVSPDHGAMPQDVMRMADDALYDAKALGRNQVVLASSHADTKQRRDPAGPVDAGIAALAAAALAPGHDPACRIGC